MGTTKQQATWAFSKLIFDEPHGYSEGEAIEISSDYILPFALKIYQVIDDKTLQLCNPDREANIPAKMIGKSVRVNVNKFNLYESYKS